MKTTLLPQGFIAGVPGTIPRYCSYHLSLTLMKVSLQGSGEGRVGERGFSPFTRPFLELIKDRAML